MCLCAYLLIKPLILLSSVGRKLPPKWTFYIEYKMRVEPSKVINKKNIVLYIFEGLCRSWVVEYFGCRLYVFLKEVLKKTKCWQEAVFWEYLGLVLSSLNLLVSLIARLHSSHFRNRFRALFLVPVQFVVNGYFNHENSIPRHFWHSQYSDRQHCSFLHMIWLYFHAYWFGT